MQSPTAADRLPLIGGLMVLASAVCWTYRRSLALVPWGRDAEAWITRADPSNPDWAKWDFLSRHFIAWRPVAAFSYTLNGWLGSSALALNVVDYAAVFATIVLTGLVGWELLRQDRDDAGATLAAYAAAVAVATHPVVQEIIPLVARRSYGLATAFGLAGLLVWLPELRRPPRVGSWRIAGATLLLVLGYGSNEAVFPIAALLPFLSWHAAPPRNFAQAVEGARPAVLPTLGALAMIAMRQAILPDAFSLGYAKKFLAYTSDGESHLRLLESAEPWTVLQAAVTYVLFPSSGSGRESLLWGDKSGWLAVAAVAVLGWVGWAGVLAPVLRGRDPVARRPAVLLLWAAITAGLYVVANTWFWREGYPLLIPFSLAIAAMMRSAVSDGGRIERGAAMVALAVLLVSVGRYSPMIGGWDARGASDELRANQLMDTLNEELPQLPEACFVWLIVPGKPGQAHDVERVAQHLRPHDTQRIRLLAWVPDAKPGAPVARVVDVDGVDQLVLDPSAQWEPSAAKQGALGDTTTIPLSRLFPGGTRPTFVWWWDGPDQATFEKVEVKRAD